MANASLPIEPDAYTDPRETAARLIAEGRAPEAVAAFQALLDAGRGGILTRIALSTAAIAAGDTKRAVTAARDAVQLAPDAVDAVMAYGEALAADTNLTGAIAEFQRAARLAPDAPTPQLAITTLWAEIGEWDKALQALDRAGGLGGDGHVLRTKIAESQSASRLPESFVRHLFDQFSADYDERMLGRLGYAAPSILRDLAAMYWGPKPKPRPILDLGCGTGLGGRAFADVAKPLTGIDLSPKMLEAAKRTGHYQSLIAADIETWLAGQPAGPFATVIAADVLGYLGDLGQVFTGVAALLSPGGEFLFTVERGEGPDFALGERRRYRHTEA
jgi:predicted TPR repeat methyltransferase